jgi:hypothetical protein
MLRPYDILLVYHHDRCPSAMTVNRARKLAHHPEITVRTAYDLKPWKYNCQRIRIAHRRFFDDSRLLQFQRSAWLAMRVGSRAEAEMSGES